MAPETGCAGTRAVCRADLQERRASCPELSHLAAGGPAKGGKSLGLPHWAAVRLSDGKQGRSSRPYLLPGSLGRPLRFQERLSAWS